MHGEDEDMSFWDIVPAMWSACRSQIIFWTPVSFTCLAVQGLMIATSLSIGVTRMSTIWTPLLITTLYIGLFQSFNSLICPYSALLISHSSFTSLFPLSLSLCLSLSPPSLPASLSHALPRLAFEGLLISPGLSVLEWPFPVGHYVATSSFFSLVGGLVSSDLFVQANSFYSSTVSSQLQ